MNKFINLFKITLLLIICTNSCKNAEKPESFSFVFMTDIHLESERKATEGFLQAIDTINKIKPDFVLTGGDLIADALGQTYGRSDSLYNLYKETITELNMPVYNTIGNHEVFGLYVESGITPENELYGKKMYEAKLTKRYYSFDINGWHFIILDGIGFTENRRYFGHIDSLQLQWLKEDLLKTGQNKPIAMSTHIPLISISSQIMTSPTAGLGRSSVITNAHDVFELIDGYNVKLVLQGHHHFLEDINYNGIHFITGGAVSSNWWNGTRYGMEEGFLKIDVTGEVFKWEYIDFGWEVK
ncbi:MAG: metallophosphoesterase [Mariniphaga sp.]|nr:metallophosphoesterase [Mariniphaga sp.]